MEVLRTNGLLTHIELGGTSKQLQEAHYLCPIAISDLLCSQRASQERSIEQHSQSRGGI